MADTFLGDKSGRTGKAGGSGDAGESPATHNNPVPQLGKEGTIDCVILLLLWKDG
jgi:hypothetical protein